ncbi:MAG: ABC transporter ATP-binding protein [Acidimicrobiales bacterium]
MVQTQTATEVRTTTDGSALLLQDVWHSYRQGEREVEILRGIDLMVHGGEYVALVGRSGSGKSTLLHVAGGLTTPTRGQVMVGQDQLADCSPHLRAVLRRRHIGFVFQFFHLLGHLRVIDNVALPLVLDGRPRGAAQRRALELLDAVELSDRALHLPAELSGGEMQRVAIARALVARPALVLADEPTGNLDSATATPVLDLLLAQVRTHEAALLLVTHEQSIAESADRVMRLEDGKLTEEAVLSV